jgi:hypothetical protein
LENITKKACPHADGLEQAGGLASGQRVDNGGWLASVAGLRMTGDACMLEEGLELEGSGACRG